jgi:hypothetical protein
VYIYLIVKHNDMGEAWRITHNKTVEIVLANLNQEFAAHPGLCIAEVLDSISIGELEVKHVIAAEPVFTYDTVCVIEEE